MNTDTVIKLIKRDGKPMEYKPETMKALFRKSAGRILEQMSEEETEAAEKIFHDIIFSYSEEVVPYEKWRDAVKAALKDKPMVLRSFLNAHQKENAWLFDDICTEMNRIDQNKDKSNGNTDSDLASSKRALIVDAVEKTVYRNYHLTPAQKRAFDEGYIYIHDMGHRRNTFNCCLFDMETVLNGGFEMGEMWYDEPENLKKAFEVIGCVTLNAAAQIYGGFTIPQIDELLVKYAEKSFVKYTEKYISCGTDKNTAETLADKDIETDFFNGFYHLEEMFNSMISPRGDYPFITITFGTGTHKYARAASLAAIEARKTGHGKEGFKKPVLFPKLVFLYDKNLHGKNGELHSLFKAAVKCSAKVMYPEYLSLTGEKGIVADVYKKYGKIISPMCCRAFLNRWFERGGEEPADENDVPVFIGRFNIGVVSLNLPMILAKSQKMSNNGKGKTTEEIFYSELDRYLEMCREIHKTTYKFLSEKKAKTNPLAFMQGGLYGGTLGREDTIEPLLKSATASFGFTALNELQRLYDGRSLAEIKDDDGFFAIEVLKYINKKAEEFRKEDHIQYTVYGTPAETLCGRQVKKFRKMFGDGENRIPDVSDREYFSNSFHCHVSEDIEWDEKQRLEARFWDLSDGGKIQYIRFTVPHNAEALESIIENAMELGLYEGVNVSLAYCGKCGHEWHESIIADRNNDSRKLTELQRELSCPECGQKDITIIERMCGYIAYTKLHNDSRLNDAKMAEIIDRVSM